ncbi:unnamed protein product, partial [Heterotrigona itama]
SLNALDAKKCWKIKSYSTTPDRGSVGTRFIEFRVVSNLQF